jgi:AcrR family transcriptional regulator
MTRRPPTAGHRSRIRWADDQPLDADDARGRILAAAVSCIDRVGADKFTVDDVARAAAISRPTLYRYFSSRNELLVAVFLKLLDDSLDRGLVDFFAGAESVEELHDGVADATAYILSVIRGSEAIQGILDDPRIPLQDLLTGAATMLVGVMQSGIAGLLSDDKTTGLVTHVRPGLDPEAAAQWVIRIVYAFLVCPAPGRERELARQHLAPAFFLDPPAS